MTRANAHSPAWALAGSASRTASVSRQAAWGLVLGYQAEDYALARQLRIDLVHPHCEYQSLQIILRHIATGALLPEPRSNCSDRLQGLRGDIAHRSDRLAAEEQLQDAEDRTAT